MARGRRIVAAGRQLDNLGAGAARGFGLACGVAAGGVLLRWDTPLALVGFLGLIVAAVALALGASRWWAASARGAAPGRGSAGRWGWPRSRRWWRR